LKEINAQYHIYQLQSDKPLRVVIRNLHPSTPESDITTALEEIGYAVRNVTNVKHHQTKTSLPMFFIDINPNGESDTDIFSITSISHTKVKIEEPHKKRQIPQCQNCQSYGLTRSYCAYPPICVKCEEIHPSSSCTKSPDLPAKCGLYQGAHPANYKGCAIYQIISRKHNNNTSSKKAQQLPPPNLIININPECQQQQPGSENTPRSRTYANVTEGHQSPNSNTSTNSNETSFLKFLDEFKSIINPFISLLTTVLSNLINTKNVK